MKLYYATGACSLSPHIVLREAGLDFTLAKVDLKTKRLADGGDFTQVNPKGYVPVLELDNGERLTEGPAIVQYLADRRPDSGLAPPVGSFARYRLQEWLNFIGTEIHKSFSTLFKPETPEEWKKIARENLGRRFDWLSGQLEGKRYLMGEQFTVADAYLFTVLNWSNSTGIDLRRWPALLAYVERVGSREKVKDALRAEGLLKEQAA